MQMLRLAMEAMTSTFGIIRNFVCGKVGQARQHILRSIVHLCLSALLHKSVAQVLEHKQPGSLLVSAQEQTLWQVPPRTLLSRRMPRASKTPAAAQPQRVGWMVSWFNT